MRKISNTGSADTNPSSLMAGGLEQAGQFPGVRHSSLHGEPRYVDLELEAMERSPDRRQRHGNLFSLLLHRLAWNR